MSVTQGTPVWKCDLCACEEQCSGSPDTFVRFKVSYEPKVTPDMEDTFDVCRDCLSQDLSKPTLRTVLVQLLGNQQ